MDEDNQFWISNTDFSFELYSYLNHMQVPKASQSQNVTAASFLCIPDLDQCYLPSPKEDILSHNKSSFPPQ